MLPAASSYHIYLGGCHNSDAEGEQDMSQDADAESVYLRSNTKKEGSRCVPAVGLIALMTDRCIG